MKCHNATDWAGGVAFDTLPPDTVHADAQIWEEAVRKLRGRLMPPPGEPQPDQKTLDSFVSWMEGELDAAAAGPSGSGLRRPAPPEPHRVRLRDQRPAGLKVDVEAACCPSDVSNEGFDNVAASLQVSPSFLDQYITAARTVSRQAVGRSQRRPQQPRVPRGAGGRPVQPHRGLPLGTRGGMHDRALFPGRRRL